MNDESIVNPNPDNEKAAYETPVARVLEVKLEQAFLQSSGSAGGFGDGGSW